ncbi:hypothetical protein JCM1841_000372 [Sporobolomyces salmonicolor]
MRRACSAAARVAALPTTRPTLPIISSLSSVAERSFSSSSRSSFFFRRPTAIPAKVAEDLLEAAEHDRPDVIARLYPSLVEAVKTSSPSSSALSHARLQSLMRNVAKANRFPLLLKMFNDLPTTFGYQHTPLDHHILVHGMAHAGKLQRALKWLDSMEETHAVRPHVSDYNTVLNGYRRQRDLEGMRHVVERMRARGIEPNVVSYNTFFSALFEMGKIDEVRRLMYEMQAKGVQPDLYTETALLTGFLEVGEMASARQIQQRLALIVEKAMKNRSIASEQYDTAVVNALIKFKSADEGFDSAAEMAEQYREQGVPLDRWTINTLVAEGTKMLRTADEGVRLIEQLEALIETRADCRAWSLAINALLTGPAATGEGLGEALKLYHRARDRSVQPDSAMVQPLLSALLLPSSTSDSLAAAKNLYEDLATSSRSYDTSPDSSVYLTLLEACANPAHPDLAYSRTLIGDMKARGIKLDSKSVTRHIVALMRAAGSFDEAFQSYDEIRALDPSMLDQKAYNTILSAFTSLSFPSSSSAPPPMAPPSLIMEFLSDMRLSAHPPNATTYSLLLTYYSRTPSASVSHIAHLHSFLKLDINLDPDTALFNSLMTAYSHVGAYTHAYRVWDSMLANANPARVGVNETSVSVLIDTCGFDGTTDAQKRARRTWRDLGEGRVPVVRNRKNWESWIECLCRWRQWDEAERVVFEDMSGGRADVPRATKVAVEVLLKFVRNAGDARWEAVRKRVRRDRPDLWDDVKDVALVPQGKWKAGFTPQSVRELDT